MDIGLRVFRQLFVSGFHCSQLLCAGKAIEGVMSQVEVEKCMLTGLRTIRVLKAY